MRNRPLILIDVDGVLADFRSAYVEATNKVLDLNCGEGEDPKLVQVEDLDGQWDVARSLGQDAAMQDQVWHELCRDTNKFVLRMPVIEGARKALHLLNHLGDIAFLTSPVLKGTWMMQRVDWLKNHFGFIAHEDDFDSRVIFCNSRYKHLVAGDAFIDDKDSTVTRWHERHLDKVAVLVDGQPNWDDIVERLHQSLEGGDGGAS